MPTPYEKLYPQSFPTPNVQDEIMVELVDISKALHSPQYNPGDYGVPYPDQTNFPGYKLVFQEPLSGSDKMVRRVYAKDRLGQDAYNAYLKYVQEGANYPIFIRTYLEKREGYQRLADLSTLQSVIGLTITSGGNGYVGDDLQHLPLIFSAGNAEGYAVIGSSGEIVELKLTDGGDSYVVAPTISLPGPGVGFAGTAQLQPASAVLVSEESKIAEGALGGSYLTVTRVYHTLPGPTLVQWLWDEQLRMFVRIRKTIVASTDVPTLDHTVGTPGIIIEYQPLDKNRYVKIESSIVYASDGAPPSDYTYPTVVPHYPLPNEIIGTPFIFYVWAINSNDIFDMDVGLSINIREGYNGPFKARITESYTFNAPAIVLPALQVFNPQAHSFAIGWWYANDKMARAQIVNISIPQTLHGELTFSAGGDSGLSNVNEVTIPATVPPSIPAAGTWICISFTEPRPYRYGLYIYRKLEIQIPSFL